MTCDTMPPEAEAIRQALDLFVTTDAVAELRALNVPQGYGRTATVAGFYDAEHLANMAGDAARLTAMKATGVYLTINPVAPDLLARRANRADRADNGLLTTDPHTLRRRWLYVDVDPTRPTGVSATDAEREAAREVMTAVDFYLSEIGWPAPLLVDSGNGFHAHYQIDLPADDGGVVKKCLQALSAMFSTPAAKVDTSVFNPSRIARLPGTWNRKGDDITARPHRQCKIVARPDELEVVPAELLEALAAQAPEIPGTSATYQAPRASLSAGDLPPVAERIDRCGRYLKTLPPAISGSGGSGRMFHAACVCVWMFGLDHDDAVSLLLSDYNGDCQPPWTEREIEHKVTDAEKVNDARGRGWLVRIEPREPRAQRQQTKPPANSTAPVRNDIAEIPVESLDGEHSSDKPARLPVWTAGELRKMFPKLRQPLIEGLLRRGETMNVVSASKVGKSWAILALALAVTTGQKWLGRFWTVRGRVLLIDNELHPETLSARLASVAESLDIPAEAYSDQIRILSCRGHSIDINKLCLELGELKPGDIDLIICDAWYRFIPAGIDENSNADITQLYNTLDGIAATTDASIVVVHHSSKGNQSGKSVVDVGSGAGAQARAPDSHLIFRQHEQDDAAVVEAAVRSFAPVVPFCIRFAFPSWSLAEDLDPADLRGTKPRKEKPVGDESAKPSKEEIAEQRERINRERVLAAYQTYPEGETERVIREAAGMSSRTFGPIQATLIRTGVVVPCKVKKQHASYAGFQLSNTSNPELGQLGQLGPSHFVPLDRGGTGTSFPPLGGNCQSQSQFNAERSHIWPGATDKTFGMANVVIAPGDEIGTGLEN